MQIPTHADLLFDLLRWDGSRTDRRALADLSAEDWSALCDLATAQQVAPLLYARLKERQLLEPVPPALATRLAGQHRASALRSLQIYHELAQIVALANELGVPLVVLKGVALAAPVYRNIALRPMGDLDLLLPEAQVVTLGAALSAKGYKPTDAEWPNAVLPRHLPPLSREGAPCLIELHWRLSTPDSSFNIPLDEIWSRLEPLELLGCRAQGLGSEDLLLHLCIHATYHHELIGVGVRFMCDLAQLLTVRGSDLNWPVLLERAARWRCERGLALALRLAYDLVGAPVPAGALAHTGADRIPADLLAAAHTQLFTSYRDGVTMPADLAQLAMTTKLGPRARALWRRVFVPRAALATQFQRSPHDPRLSLFYLVRFWLLLRRHGGTVAAMASGDAQSHGRAARRALIAGWLGSQ